MKKEVVIAILVGFIIGLIATVLLHSGRSSDDEPQVSPSAGLSQEENEVEAHTIEMQTPELHALVDSENLLLRGLTSPGSFVAVISEVEEKTSVAKDTGLFTEVIGLNPGPNTISIFSYHPDGREATASVTVTYSTAEIESNGESTDETE